MTYETVTYSLENGVATIGLNRPDKLNPFNRQMVKDTTNALKAANRDPEARCVLLTGNGRGFSSGQDLMEAAQGFASGKSKAGDSLRKSYHPLIDQIFNSSQPIVCAINGIAAGIGMSISLTTDIRIASDQAAFTLGFSKIGLVPDGGANWILPRMIGYSRAYQIALTSEKISAAQALEWGIVNQVVPHDQLMEVAQATATKIASGPTLAFALTKKAMLRGLSQTLEENLDYEAHLQNVAGASEDSREGVMAFIEKRPATYKGK